MSFLFDCVGCSSVEQKVEQLSEMTAQRLQNSEDRVQEIKRCELMYEDTLM